MEGACVLCWQEPSEAPERSVHLPMITPVEAGEKRTIVREVRADLRQVQAWDFPIRSLEHEYHRPMNVLVVDREVLQA